MTHPTEPIGPLLDKERRAAAVTYREIADAIGCSEPHAWNMLQGKKTMRVDQLDAILRLLRPRFDLARALDLKGDEQP